MTDPSPCADPEWFKLAMKFVGSVGAPFALLSYVLWRYGNVLEKILEKLIAISERVR